MSERQLGLAMKFENSVKTGQAARMIGRALGTKVSRQTVVRLIERGDITGRRLYSSGQWFIDYQSLVSYINSVRETPPN